MKVRSFISKEGSLGNVYQCHYFLSSTENSGVFVMKSLRQEKLTLLTLRTTDTTNKRKVFFK